MKTVVKIIIVVLIAMNCSMLFDNYQLSKTLKYYQVENNRLKHTK